MKKIRIGLIISILFSLIFSGFTHIDAGPPPFDVKARAGLLLDFESGQVLYAKNESEQLVPASLVKIMTMYLAFDQIKSGRIGLQDTTKVSEKPWRITGSKMFLEPNEVVTIEQLLEGIAVVSGNDACVALAEALAGTEEAFVQWMNDKAKSLELDLYFVDVHGLSAQNRITAKDVALLVRNYLHDHPEAIDFHKQKSFSYQPRSSKTPIVQSNRNGLLNSFNGADGLKTGHLEAAGYNLIGTAVQNNHRLISVVLGASGESAREQETANMLNYGFRNFDLVDISPLLQDKTVKILKGQKREVGMYTNDALISVPKGIEDSVSVGIQTSKLEAPIAKDTEIGTLSIFMDEELVKKVPLLASEDVAKGSWIRVAWDSVVKFFQDLIKRA